ncbi:MAG: Trp family transcriptional regulator [Patescibacteria group bacterium]|nr:Trp family transcriptional regulator [Patescibacteria group bacterium]
MLIKFPQEIFSPKELLDFKRRVRVSEFLKSGKTWNEIRQKTGAHLQTISLVSKRLKAAKSSRPGGSIPKTNQRTRRGRTIFVFGQPE